MFYHTWPTWDEIGKHLGKRLRDIISPLPYNGEPSDAEKLARRLQDVHKGFAYLNTFDELESWHEADELQRANTPLQVRPSHSVASSRDTAKVLICHDYKGGYQDYEGVRPPLMDIELYSCETLQSIEAFVYFSHKLVSPPPPTWTNALHRNGTQSLGTFIVEPQTSNVERMLVKDGERYIIADRLTAMTEALGFDGWLLNIECEFTHNATSELVCFTKYLRDLLGPTKKVIWYDALTTLNKVKYQNGLTAQNIVFAEAAGSLFTNYKWTERTLLESKELAANSAFDLSKIYFGIDVWAQNTNYLGHPRVTFPSKGGGGTNTGFAVGKLAEEGLSAAIFAPAWTHEHFSAIAPAPQADSLSSMVSRSLWHGATLPELLGCDCKIGRPHHTDLYEKNPVCKWATEYRCGSSVYFESTFKRPFQHHPRESPRDKIASTLALQEPSPCLNPRPLRQWEITSDGTPDVAVYAKYMDVGPQTKDTIAIHVRMIGDHDGRPTGSSRAIHRLCLFTIAIANDKPLLLQALHSTAQNTTTTATYGFYVQIQRGDIRSYEYYEAGSKYGFARYVLKGKSGATVVELGVFYNGTLEVSDLELFRCQGLSIIPERFIQQDFHNFGIQITGIFRRGDGPYEEKRLVWEWKAPKRDWPFDAPWSAVTGPFSHFTICIDGEEVGHAHCVEFPLKDSELPHGHTPAYTVVGHLFAGIDWDKRAVSQNACTFFHRSWALNELSEDPMHSFK